MNGGIQVGQTQEVAIGGDVLLESPLPQGRAADFLDRIEFMTGVGRQIHKLDARLPVQPSHERLAGVNGGVVDNDEDQTCGIALSQQGQEGDEIGGAFWPLERPFVVGEQVVPVTRAHVQATKYAAAAVHPLAQPLNHPSEGGIGPRGLRGPLSEGCS